MNDYLEPFIDQLRASTSFESAARVALDTLLARVETTMRAHPLRDARLLRGTVHVRPEHDGYRGFLCVEAGSVPERPPAERRRTRAPHAVTESVRVASAGAWHWIRERGVPIAVDVHTNTVTLPDGAEVSHVRGRNPGAFTSGQTTQRLIDRSATHVFVVPLRTPRGEIGGMIAVEANCQAAIGRPFIWSSCAGDLQRIADLASPYLFFFTGDSAKSAIDDTTVHHGEGGELLPVVGKAMAGIIHTLRGFSDSDETILLTGETGVGKSRLAAWCHQQSGRRGDFESVIVSGQPRDLQIAQLTGWKKGAFTGATKNYAGTIARARGGTVFLDEIDSLSPEAQTGLLGLLDEKRYSPLGGGSSVDANVRFIVATNADLRRAVSRGLFRQDLYYRVTVLPIRVPSLDERRDEIGAWADYLLAERAKPERARISDEGHRVLESSRWPGNLRELKNVISRALALARIDVEPGKGETVLGMRHVQQALVTWEQQDSHSSESVPQQQSSTRSGGEIARTEHPAELLRAAARAFVQAKESGAPLLLDDADAFRGYVLNTAVERQGSSAKAFRLFGEHRLVKGHNHQKTLRLAQRAVEDFERKLERGSSEDDRTK